MDDVPRKDFRSREIFIDAFVTLVQRFSEVNFVLKLHPSEDHEFYKDLVNERLSCAAGRVRIIVHEYIWDVLNATDIELNRSCTTAIESWLIGKPTIEMQLNPDEWYFSPEHASGSDIVHSEEALVEKVADYLAGAPVAQSLQEARDRFIKKWCHRVEGDSTMKMVAHLHRLLTGDHAGVHNNDELPASWKQKVYFSFLAMGDYVGHDLRVYGLKNTLTGSYVDKLGRFDKYFHHRDIAEWRERLSRLPVSE